MFSSDVVWFLTGFFFGAGFTTVIMSIMFVAGREDRYHD
jgi:hypothetical protein